MDLNKDYSLEKKQAEELENKTESERRFDRGTELDFFDVAAREKRADESSNENDVATNDGSVVGTLDTAFHDVPGSTHHEDNVSGSNRNDYYEARSNSKSDTEEELEARQKASEGEAGT